MYAHDYLVKARHDDRIRAAAQARLAAQARRARRSQRHQLIAPPGRRLTHLRSHRAAV